MASKMILNKDESKALFESIKEIAKRTIDALRTVLVFDSVGGPRAT